MDCAGIVGWAGRGVDSADIVWSGWYIIKGSAKF